MWLKKDKKKLTVSVFMPSSTPWQSCNNTALLSLRRFPPLPLGRVRSRRQPPHLITDGETDVAIPRHGAQRDKQEQGLLSDELRASGTSIERCWQACHLPGRGCKQAKQQAATAPANKLMWKASSGTVWESRVKPCQLLKALKALVCGVCLSLLCCFGKNLLKTQNLRA